MYQSKQNSSQTRKKMLHMKKEKLAESDLGEEDPVDVNGDCIM